ncbi:TrbG/VirB9 family P-type conjugative transfer protein [Neisseria gonorrhoeae]|uniref:TrbG/VirB9 family P-type conjugative transfer protein n=1 Tax=Neisseria gonorrhoeae TaxID=485 RepID=UPI000DFE5997|nr:TrbG/VirB9 family P-type conjugative transfer protein [Neisseria gonorrhoeae]SUA29611.1 Type IV secretory pathway, VirB9 components [Neisseria gonorrhoeae]
MVRTKVGTATIIQLELMSGLLAKAAQWDGDAEAWKMTARDKHFLQTYGRTPDTNLLITTNKRTYAFDLKSTMDTATYLHFAVSLP